MKTFNNKKLRQNISCIFEEACIPIGRRKVYTDRRVFMLSAKAVEMQILKCEFSHDLRHKIGATLQPVFISRKLGQDFKPREIKPPIVNQQCVVYSFMCDLCDSGYVGYTAQHLHQRIAEHKNSAIG